MTFKYYIALVAILATPFVAAVPQSDGTSSSHIVFVLGEKEYKTLETVPAFFESTLKPAGYTAAFITAPPEGEDRNDFSGLAEALEDADVCFVSVRRRAPAKKDMKALKKFVANGKPIVAIRTSSHAFHLKDKPIPEGHAVWEKFDPAILGGNYNGHYREELAKISVARGAAGHPILKSIGKLPSSDKLYKPRPLAESTTLLLNGTIEGKEPEPVAWTNTTGENGAKIFYTSLGQDTDFADAEFRKFLKNAVAWAVADTPGRPRIAAMETVFGKRGDASSFADAKAAGYTAIQMHSGQPAGMSRNKPIDPSTGLAIGEDPSILEAWSKASREHGIEIVSLCAGSLNPCEIWDRDREVAMRIARQTIDGCHALDVHTMLFPFFGPSNFQESDEALEGIADFMKELLPYAQEKDVVIGIEAPVTTVRVLELFEKLNYPEHLKVYYDTGNLFAKEDIYETIRKYGKEHFCQVHIKPAGNAVVGDGEIDLAKLAAALDTAGYDGWLVYESGRDGKDPVGNRKGIERIVSLRK